MKTHYRNEEFYRAYLARDPRYDGKFFVAVKTTRIYCRPICPARKARLKNLEFFIHAAQAEEAGYRPCLRCRPETAPGSPAWIGTSSTVKRAIRMMDHFALEGLAIKDIAEKLGIGERWLRELFQQQVGASPQTILTSRKLDIARNLSEGNLYFQLSYRPPYAWDSFELAVRAIVGQKISVKAARMPSKVKALFWMEQNVPWRAYAAALLWNISQHGEAKNEKIPTY